MGGAYRSAAGAGLAGLFLVLAAIVVLLPGSSGFTIELRDNAASPEFCWGFKMIVVQVLADGSVQINHERVPNRQLGDRLDAIYSVRAERVLYLRADAQVEFQRLAEVLDIANRSTTDLRVRLLTPAVEQEPCIKAQNDLITP